MRAILTMYLASALVAFAQNVAVLTHEAARTDDFKAGCPGAWPYKIEKLGKSAELPAHLPSDWVVMTEESLKDRMALLDADKADWNRSQEQKELAPAEAKKTESNAEIAELESVLKNWESADEKSRGEVLRKLLHLILQLLRDLGSPVQGIEKPTEKQ